MLIRKNVTFVSVTCLILVSTAALAEDTRRNYETVANTSGFQGRYSAVLPYNLLLQFGS